MALKSVCDASGLWLPAWCCRGTELPAPARLHPLILTSFSCLASSRFVSPTPCPADSEDDGESEAAKQLIQPIAEKIIAKYKAKEEEAPLLFFVAGEVSEESTGLCPAECGD